MSSRRRVPWDGPNPAPGEFLAGRGSGLRWRIIAVTPLRHADQFGNRLDLELQPILPEAIPDGSVIHPWIRAQPSIEAGPARVRQLAACGPTAVMRDDWNDPDDMRPRARKPRQVSGWRRFDPLRRMTGVEPRHRIAAEIFRREVEETMGGHITSDWMTPVHDRRHVFFKRPLGIADAAESVACVFGLFASEQRRMLAETVLLGRSIAVWCEQFTPPRNKHVETGRLLSILDVLTEHYLAAVEAELADDQAG